MTEQDRRDFDMSDMDIDIGIATRDAQAFGRIAQAIHDSGFLMAEAAEVGGDLEIVASPADVGKFLAAGRHGAKPLNLYHMNPNQDDVERLLEALRTEGMPYVLSRTGEKGYPAQRRWMPGLSQEIHCVLHEGVVKVEMDTIDEVRGRGGREDLDIFKAEAIQVADMELVVDVPTEILTFLPAASPAP